MRVTQDDVVLLEVDLGAQVLQAVVGYEVDYREDGVYLSLRRGELGEDGKVGVGLIAIVGTEQDIYLTDGGRNVVVWEASKRE